MSAEWVDPMIQWAKDYPASAKWEETRRDRDRDRDRPDVSVRFPSEMPMAYLNTIGHGCGEPDTLPPGVVYARLRIAGVDIHASLDELTMLVDAAREQVGDLHRVVAQFRAAEVPT